MLTFFDWAYKNGDGWPTSLDYVPLPRGGEGPDPQVLGASIKDRVGQAGRLASRRDRWLVAGDACPAAGLPRREERCNDTVAT